MEHRINVHITADALISSLGFTPQENLEAIRRYQSEVTLQEGGHYSDTPMLAATISSERLEKLAMQKGLETYTRLEQLFILTIQDICTQAGISPTDENCGLILSTTKGNVDLLASGSSETSLSDEKAFLWKMAERIGCYFQSSHPVEVVSNACISGISAIIVGKRWIESGRYTKVIVAGGDILSHFITSGFLSFKSVSNEICRPYDEQRDGLNLGEACGAILLSTDGNKQDIILTGGAISNDANHISGPSRTGDGLYLAIHQAMEEAEVQPKEISFINAHGTATVYNDEMESKAIHLARLDSIPVNSLKPYFGHTLGASGVIETIISMHEMKEGELFGTLGYEHCGVPMPLKVNATHQKLPMKHCVKTASGFGGCNAAIVLSLPHVLSPTVRSIRNVSEKTVTHTISITPGKILRNGKEIFHSKERSFPLFIREAYKTLEESNMKFFKMDDLCKLGYVATEFLLKDKTFQPEEIGIILSNAAASLDTDIRHQAILNKDGDAAASPAVFVYTLPNVVAGEICIRHRIKGENTFFIHEEYQPELLEQYARIAMEKGNLKACITGWCDLLLPTYQAEFKLIEIQ